MRVCHSDVSARSHAHMHTCTHACMHTHGTRSGRIVGIECAFSWVIVCGRHGLVAPTERQPHVSCSSVRACQHRGSASNTHTPHTSERMRSSRATNPHPSAPAPPYPSKVGYISLPLPAHVHPMRHPTLAHTHTGTRPQHQTASDADASDARRQARPVAHAHTRTRTRTRTRTPPVQRALHMRAGYLEPVQRLWLAGRGGRHGSVRVAGHAPQRTCRHASEHGRAGSPAAHADQERLCVWFVVNQPVPAPGCRQARPRWEGNSTCP